MIYIDITRCSWKKTKEELCGSCSRSCKSLNLNTYVMKNRIVLKTTAKVIEQQECIAAAFV